MVTHEQPELAGRVARVLEPRREILEAYLFGSAAIGAAQPHSDLDVAVCIADPRPASPSGYAADLAAALMAALGVPRVDVVVLDDAPPLLHHRVLRDGVRILSRDLRATTTREGRACPVTAITCPRIAKIEAAHRGRLEAGQFGR